MKTFNSILLGLGVILSGLFIAICIVDLCVLVDCRISGSKNCWYNPSVLKTPITHLYLACHKGKTYLTHNVVGDTWKVRDTQVGEQVFWTRLEVVEKHQ